MLNKNVPSKINELSASLKDIVTVNIVNNGVNVNIEADQTSKLQTVFDALNHGDTILFPKGNYRIEGTVTINKNIKIIGYGSRIKHSTQSALFQIIGVEDVIIEGITLDGEWDGNSDSLPRWSHDGLYIVGCKNVRVLNCNIKNFSDSGLRISNSLTELSSIRENIDTIVNGCLFDNVLQISTTFGGCKRYIFTNNTLKNMKSQLKFGSDNISAENIIISNNIFDSFVGSVQLTGSAIVIENCNKVLIDGNIFDNLTSITGLTMGAIRLNTKYDNITISNNKILNVQDTVITCAEGNSSNVSIHSNNMVSAKRFLEVKSTSLECLRIYNNSFDTCTDFAFYLKNLTYLGKCIFKNNNCVNLFGGGSNFYINNTDKLIFDGNDFINSGKGITLYGVKESEITNNLFNNTSLVLFCTPITSVGVGYTNRVVVLSNNILFYPVVTVNTGFFDFNQIHLYAFNNKSINATNVFKVTDKAGYTIFGEGNTQTGGTTNLIFPANQ